MANSLIRCVPQTTSPQPSSLAIEIQRFVRANTSTLLATGIEWGLVTILVRSGAYYLVAAALGALLGATMDFALKRKWAFMRRGAGSLHTESTRYFLVSVLSLGWNLGSVFGLVHWLHVPALPAIIGTSVLVGVLWNYPLHRLFVFPQDAAPRLLPRAA